jgi:putative hydrolase of HD superfamily
MGFLGVYLLKMRGLMELKRYQNLFLHKQRSVAEHCWSVSKTAQQLALLEMRKFGNVVDMGELLSRTLNHDDLELITGDILSNTKRRTPAMRRAVESMEKVVFIDEYSEMLPKGCETDFRRFTLDAKDDTIEGKILGAADVIDTLFESAEEIELGNKKYFKDVFNSSIEKLLLMDLQSVRYFLKNSLVDLEMDLSKYLTPKVLDGLEMLKVEEPILIGV